MTRRVCCHQHADAVRFVSVLPDAEDDLIGIDQLADLVDATSLKLQCIVVGYSDDVGLVGPPSLAGLVTLLP